ncbi:hypothetical protein D3C75_349160 [compost metagenome]
MYGLLAYDLAVARGGRDQPPGVIQRTRLKPGVARDRHDLPVAVINGTRLELDAVRRTNLPLPVIDVARQVYRQRAAAALDDVALLVTEVVSAEVNRLRAQRAAVVIE